MPSKKQQANVTKYVATHYDQIKLTVPKGEREKYKAAAKSLGFSSLNKFIAAAMDYAIEQELKSTEDK